MLRWLAAIYLTSLIFWCWGVAIGMYQVFPYMQIKSKFDEIQKFLAGNEETGPELAKELGGLITEQPVHHLRNIDKSVEALVPGKEMFPIQHIDSILGVATGDEGSNAYLLYDSSLEVIKKWSLDYSKLFPDGKADARVNIHGAKMLSDGSLLANFDNGGIVRMDWCGRKIWAFEEPITHHLITETERNTIWVAGRKILQEKLYGYPEGAWDDILLEISIDDGTILQSISSATILFKNQLHGNLEWVDSDVDFTHINDIEELPKNLAEAFPMFARGDLLVNAKRINMLFVVDPSTLRVKWHRQSPWNQPHDPDFMPSGEIRIFDNNQDRNGHRGWGNSRVLLINPSENTTKVLFTHPALHSNTGSLVEGPNDSMLITYANSATAINVTDGLIDFVFRRPYNEKRNYYIKNAKWYPKSHISNKNSCN